MLHLILISALALALPCPVKTRAVFDVGSGTTKLNVSQVELCPGGARLIRVLEDRASEDVPLEANRLPDDRISPNGIELQMNAIARLRKRVRELVPAGTEVEFAAAGTHAFRTAKNQDEITRRFAEVGIPIVPLTQEQEALVGFHAVRAPMCAGKNLLVWDVGGGSMQFTTPGPHVTGLALGAETFKRKLKLERAAKCPVPKDTVNPIGVVNAQAVLDVARHEARAALPASLTGAPRCAVGIGGLHVRAIEGAITRNWDAIRTCVCGPTECSHVAGRYTRAEVACLASFLSEKDDCAPEIKGPYSSTAVSNLYLVLGFMNAMHLETVLTESINMGHGLALDRKLLTFKASRLQD